LIQFAQFCYLEECLQQVQKLKCPKSYEFISKNIPHNDVQGLK
jgi:hypothetical protein